MQFRSRLRRGLQRGAPAQGLRIVDPRRTRLIFIDEADNLGNAIPRSLGIVLARMRQIAEQESVAFVLVGTGVLEALLSSLPYAATRFRIVRYPVGSPVRNVPAAPGRSFTDPELRFAAENEAGAEMMPRLRMLRP